MDYQYNYLLSFILLSFGLVFLAIGRLGDRSATAWGCGYIASSLGLAKPILLILLPAQGQAILSSLFFFTAFYFYGEALLLRFGRPRLMKLRVGISLIGLVAVGYFVFVADNHRNEMLAGDIVCALLLAVPLAAVARQVRRPIDSLLIAMVYLVFLETLMRLAVVAVTTSSQPQSFEIFLASDYAFVMQVGASIIGFLMALTALAATTLDIIGDHQNAAGRDSMTEALNRRGFDQATANRGERPPQGAIICCDVDHFKRVNDEYGHAAGDRVIIMMADLLRRRLPRKAIVARFGGEEFVAFLPGMSLTDAGMHAEVVRQAFGNRRWETSGIRKTITASFGVSAVVPSDQSVHDAIARGDACLYAAKEGGRNKVVIEGRMPPKAPSNVHNISAA